MVPEFRTGRRRVGWLLCICIAAPLFASGATEVAGKLPAGFPESKLEIRTAKGKHWFKIQIADTPARQEQGLMFVRNLPASQGMLFPQSQPRMIAMWMKNTLIPLDMLFIDARGRIVCLRERAVPQSEDLITCDQPAKAVLEIGGGEATRRGISVGDIVVHQSLTQ
jgi:hypothetical protein